MTKISHTKRSILLLAIFIALQLENFFIGLDTFGLIVGMYGITIPYPLNVFVSILVLGLYVMIGHLIGLFFNRPGNTNYDLYGYFVSFTLYLFTMSNNPYLGVITYFALFIFVTLIYQRGEKQQLRNDLSFKNNIDFLKLILLVLVTITIVNYILWFTLKPNQFSSTRVVKPSFFLILIGRGEKYSITVDFLFYIVSDGTIFNFKRLGLGTAFIFNAIGLGYYIYLVWQNINDRIDQLSIKSEIWFLQPHEEISIIWITKGSMNESLTKVSVENSERYRIEYDPDQMSDLESLIYSDLKNLIASKENSFTHIDLKIEKKVVEEGRRMGNLLESFSTNNGTTNNGIKEPILLINDIQGRFPIEGSLGIYQSNNNIYDRITPIRFYNKPGLPIRVKKQISVLHIASSGVESLLLQRKLEMLLKKSGANADIININKNSDIHNLKSQTTKSYDVLILSLHSKLKQNRVEFVDGDGNFLISADSLINNISSNIPIGIVTSCHSFIYGDNDGFPQKLLKEKSDFVISSASAVLSSHLSLIILPIIEYLQIESVVSIYDIQQIIKLVYRTILKFGYTNQFNSLRFMINQKCDDG